MRGPNASFASGRWGHEPWRGPQFLLPTVLGFASRLRPYSSHHQPYRSANRWGPVQVPEQRTGMFVMREDDHQRNERRECEYSEYTPRKACSPSWWTSQGRIMLEEMKRCVPTKRTAKTPIATIGFICSLSDRRAKTRTRRPPLNSPGNDQMPSAR